MGVGISVQPFIVLPEWNARLVPWNPTHRCIWNLPSSKDNITVTESKIFWYKLPPSSLLLLQGGSSCSSVNFFSPQLAISGNQNTRWEKWKLTDLWPSGTHLLPSLQRDGAFQGTAYRQLYLHSVFCAHHFSTTSFQKSHFTPPYR